MGQDYPLNGEFLMGHEDSESTFLTFSQYFYGLWNIFCAWSSGIFNWVEVMA